MTANSPEQSLDECISQLRQRLQGVVGTGPKEGPSQGINHLAVFALDLEATAEFYINVMGMPVTGVTDNRDEPRSTHMIVDIGAGVSLAFFDFPHVERLKVPAPEGVGGVMHVAIPVSRQVFQETEVRLKRRSVPYRRIGDSVYIKDPNGMTLELMIV